MCARAAGTEALVNSTVCASRPLSWRGRTLRKVSDGVFWTYQLPAEAGQKRPPSLASCSAMGGGSRPGLRTANLPYDNLVLTIHFRAHQVGRSAERRVGKECVSKVLSRGAPEH